LFLPEGSVRPCSLGDAIALVSSGECVGTGGSPGTGRVSNPPEDSPQGSPVGLSDGFLGSGAIRTMNVRNENARELNDGEEKMDETLPGLVVDSLGGCP